MQQWVKHDRTLVCLQSSAEELAELKGDAHFFDEDYGFVTAIAFRPSGARFKHLRLA